MGHFSNPPGRGTRISVKQGRANYIPDVALGRFDPTQRPGRFMFTTVKFGGVPVKPYYRLLMRGATCVGVAVGVDENITLVTELSGRPDAIDSFIEDIPKVSDNSEEWFYALNDLLPMTYKIGNIHHFDGDDPKGSDSQEAARALAAEVIVVDSRSSRLQTTRVEVSASIVGAADETVGSRASGKLKGRAQEDAEATESEILENVEIVDEDSVAEEVEPEEPREPSPDIVVVQGQQDRVPLSIADDGAGVHEKWFLLLEDWQGLAAVFAGNREQYSVLARSTTQLMSEQIAEAVPSQAANLEHWVTMLIRELPAGVWLRSFTSVSSVTDEEVEEPIDILKAVIAFYGTPKPDSEFEFFAGGDVDGTLTTNRDSGELTAPEFTDAEAQAKADAVAEHEAADAEEASEETTSS